MKKNAITKELSLRAKFKSSTVVEVCIMNMVTNEVIVRHIVFQFGDTDDVVESDITSQKEETNNE